MINKLKLPLSIALVALGAFSGAFGQAQDPAFAKVSIGGGLEGLADWSYSNAFADLVKQSRAFGSVNAPWDAKAKVDAAGWPTEDFGVVLGIWGGQKGIGGTYRLQLKCAALPTIKFPASSGTIKNLKRDSAGVVTADLIIPSNSEQLMLSFEGTKGGVKDLKVLRPGASATDVFTPAFLDHLKRFSTLRFMDWEGTNGSRFVKWSERPLVTTPSYAAAGAVPWEVCIDLCNKLKKDAWINVPHKADDAYVTNLAKLIKQRLDKSLHVYVEYSNEVWNWGFEQATWNANQAKADVKAGDKDLTFDKSTDENQWTARRLAKRIKVISDIFRREYGDLAINTTVRPVLGTQVAWPGFWLNSGLTFLNDRFGPPNNYLYGVAVAPYFNMGEADKKTNLTANDVISALNAGVESYRTDLTLEACASQSRFYNLKLVAYEGGPDTFGPNNVAAKKAASLDSRMQGVSAKYLQVMFGYGFDLFNWFVAGATNYDTQYGTWGLTNDMTNQKAPKILAIDQINTQAYVALNQGIALPATIDPRQFTYRDANWKTSGTLRLDKNDWRGPYRDYFVRVTKAQTYQLAMNCATDNAGVTVEIWLDNAKLGTVKPANTGSFDKYVATSNLAIKPTIGLHVVRLKVTNGSVNVKSISVK